MATEDGPFDIVVTDVVMPGENGPQFVKRLQARDDDFKVLFVSGYNESEVLADQVRRDDVAFLPKPFEPQDLLEALARLLT